MPTPSDSYRRADAGQLLEWMHALLCTTGLRDDDATAIANNLIEAESRGVCSHGLMLLPMYIDRIRGGGINIAHQMRVLSDQPGMLVLDADRAPGQTALGSACRTLAARARQNGIAAINVVNNNHVGMLATYARVLAEQGCISIVMTTAGASVYPHRGLLPSMGNNALCIGVPADGHPFIFDMATGIVACGKIRYLDLIGAAMPEGWAEGPERRATRDTSVLDQGGGVLSNGHKGFAWACVVDILAGLVAPQGRVGMDVLKQRQDFQVATACSQTVFAISVAQLGNPDFGGDVAGYLRRLRDFAPQDPQRPVLAPGDPELLCAADAQRHGLKIYQPMRERLEAIGLGADCAMENYVDWKRHDEDLVYYR